jgi:hypothetical protein
MLRWSVLRDAAGCTVTDRTCPNRDHFTRELTTGETARLRATFRDVQVVERMPTGCANIAIDPWLVNAFRWDDFVAVDFLCHTPLLSSDEAERLLAVLEELTAG